MKKTNTKSKFEMVQRLLQGNSWVLNMNSYLEKLKTEALTVKDYSLAASIRKQQLDLIKTK